MLHGFQYLLAQLAGDQAQANSQANSSFLEIMALLIPILWAMLRFLHLETRLDIEVQD